MLHFAKGGSGTLVAAGPQEGSEPCSSPPGPNVTLSPCKHCIPSGHCHHQPVRQKPSILMTMFWSNAFDINQV